MGSTRSAETLECDARVQANQRRLTADPQPSYDFIVCGSGSSGSVVAGRLAETGRASVLLLEAGGTDDVPAVREAQQSLANLRSERDWGFQAVPNPLLNGRRLSFSMGKVLGGGSSINAMVWSRGHKNDWDFFADEAGDPSWSYESGLHYSAALMISSATSFGKDSIATWLDGTSIAVALAAFTWSLSICGGMIISFVATTMKVGFSRHAAWLTGAVRVLMWNGPCVAATTACSSGERSAAKYLLMPSSLIVR
jgi:choline dehydrogenase-like flavoprotein